mmetsp:Transcript_7920/g.16555  ORF Transcript_7920/g.16555 Transcript_7920/m.16555 type:complete len:294 (-) Transcript_7920:238-1119(-)
MLSPSGGGRCRSTRKQMQIQLCNVRQLDLLVVLFFTRCDSVIVSTAGGHRWPTKYNLQRANVRETPRRSSTKTRIARLWLAALVNMWQRSSEVTISTALSCTLRATANTTETKCISNGIHLRTCTSRCTKLSKPIARAPTENANAELVLNLCNRASVYFARPKQCSNHGLSRVHETSSPVSVAFCPSASVESKNAPSTSSSRVNSCPPFIDAGRSFTLFITIFGIGLWILQAERMVIVQIPCPLIFNFFAGFIVIIVVIIIRRRIRFLIIAYVLTIFRLLIFTNFLIIIVIID